MSTVFRYDFILGTCGLRWRSISWEIFSVGPPQPLTMGLTAMGVLCTVLCKLVGTLKVLASSTCSN